MGYLSRPAIAAALLGLSVTWPAGAQPKALQAFDHLPLSFEANQGQTDGRVRFLAHGPGYMLFLTPTGSVLESRGSALRVALVGANPATQLSGVEERPGRSNYLIGNDATRWRTGVKQYGKVRYDGVYPGIDLVYYGNPREVEYDFVVAPGADPGTIALAIEGGRPRMEASGDLLVRAAGREIRLRRPVIYQDQDGVRRPVAGGYVVKGKRVQFRVAAYDHQRPLVIDPSFGITFTQDLAGTGSANNALAVAVDAAGNSYVTGFTNSSDFPTAGPAQAKNGGFQDAFVTKISADGSTIAYSTYLGGSGNESGNAIAVDSAGNAYVFGGTASSNFPVTSGAIQKTYGGGIQDAFVTKLNAAGNAMIYSTYLGGNDLEFANAIALGPDGSAYLAGATISTNFPVTSGAYKTKQGTFQNAYVAKLNPAGSALTYSTYLGGSTFESAGGIAVDSGGNAYVAGQTNSSDFPTTTGAFQTAFKTNSGFVSKLNPTGTSLVYSTLLAGSKPSAAFAITLDAAGNAYVAGTTQASDFPTTSSAYQKTLKGPSDAFLVKLNATGTSALFSTLLGGSGDESGLGVALGPAASAGAAQPVWLVGSTTGQADFPTASPVQACAASTCGTRACTSGTATQLAADGSSLLFSTCLGEAGGDYVVNAVTPVGQGVVLASKAFVASGTAPNPGVEPLENPGGNLTFLEKGRVVGVAPCTYSLQPTVFVFDSQERTAAQILTVTAPKGCSWTVATNVSWINLGATVGAGTDIIQFTLAANTSGVSRTGTIIVQGVVVTIMQAAADCTYTWSPSAIEFGPQPDSRALTVTTKPGCPWSAVSFNRRVTIAPGAGTGNATLDVQITVFDGGSSGAADLVTIPLSVTGGQVTITQFGPASISDGSTVGGAAGGKVSGGGISSLYGSNLAPSTGAPSGIPLPTQLNGSKVTLTGTGAGATPVDAPLFFVSTGQINFQMPWELLGQTRASLTVRANGATSAPVTVNLDPLSPGIFAINGAGTGQGVVLTQAGEIAAPTGSIPGAATRPVMSGEFLTIYCAGLGDVSNRPATGAASPANPLASTLQPVMVTIGGMQTPASFAGLTPGLVGLFQVNVQVPAGITAGSAVPMTLTVGGVTSNMVTIAVQ